MYRTVVVPLDGSGFAEDALPLARLLSRRLGAELHLVHVIPPEVEGGSPASGLEFEWKERAREGAGAYLREQAEAARSEGISTLTAVLEGGVVSALRDYGAEQDADLFVMTSHGAGGVRRWWLGSVADGLLRTGGTDLLLVRPWDDTEDRPELDSRFQRILVPLDGSGLAETALRPARVLASRFEAELILLRVVPAPVELTSVSGVPGVKAAGEGHRRRRSEAEAYLAGVVGESGEASPKARVAEASGAAEGIVAAARDGEADLIVLSSHGRGGVERIVLGSVSDKVVRTTARPVLVIRAREG